MQQCFAYLGYRPEDCPESARAARETLALPIYPELSEAQLQHVVDTISGLLRQGMSDMDLSGCFKAYDVRGRVPEELNPDSVYRIGRAYADWLRPRRVAVGRDIRLSSKELAAALIRGLNDAGVDVVDIGLCGTECVYFATVLARPRRRRHGHREPQSAGLQRPQVRARAVAAGQRRHRTAGHPPPRRSGGVRQHRRARHGRHVRHHAVLARSRAVLRGTRQAEAARRSSATRAMAARASRSTCSRTGCRSASPRSSTRPTARSRTACRTR